MKKKVLLRAPLMTVSGYGTHARTVLRALKAYEEYFKELTLKSLNILEIGFGHGASIKMWLEYFPFSKIYCIDIGDFSNCKINSNRFISFSGDQSNIDDLNSFINKIGKIKF